MNNYKTLADASKLIAEKQMQIDENHITQYIKTAMEIVERKGESLEDYALIKIQNPMQLKDDKNSVVITSQWRLIHVSKLENVPEYDND